MQTPIRTPDESATALGAFFCLVWLVVILWWIVAKSRVVADTVAWFRRKAVPARIFALLVLLAIVAIGGSKSGGPLGTRPETAFPPFALVEARTNGVVLAEASTNAVVSESCLRHGTSEGGEWIEAETPFFRWGTNDIRRLYASPACLSFGTMRHPFHGDTLPNGTSAESLVVLRMPLGIVPAANWHLLEGTGVVSRFWHDALPGGGRVFTWENALLDRLADRPATIQAELHRNGDFIYRYDFSESGPPSGRPLPADYPAVTPGVVPVAGHNPVLIGAQRGVVGVEAFRAVGATTNCAIVYRLDGDTATNGVSLATLLAAAPLLELRWKNVADLGDLSADTDNDGLTNWQEAFLHGTDPRYADTDGDGRDDGAEIAWGDDPFDADENGDGVPDGMDEEDWLANPLWASNAEETNVVISLLSAIPAGGVATLVVGDLSLPLRNPTDIPIFLPPGEYVPFRLVSHDAGNIALSLDDAAPVSLRGHVPDIERPTGPLWVDVPSGVFGGLTPSGSGAMAVPTLHLKDADGNEDETSVCVHDDSPISWSFSVDPATIGLTLNDVHVEGFLVGDANTVSLSVDEEYPCEATGTVALAPPQLFRGVATVSRSIHRCVGLHLSRCEICDMDHDSGEPYHCPHAEDCPTRTNAVSSCTCPTPVIRVQGTGTALSEYAALHFPVAGQCCCSPDLALPHARIKRIDADLHVTNSLGTVTAPSDIGGSAVVHASAVSGSRASEIEYEIVHRHYDEGGDVTNEVTRTSKMPVWAVDILHEPVTTATVGGKMVNPSGIVRGTNALFSLSISPASFPDSLVEWSCTPSNAVSFVSANTGRSVTVRGVTNGDATLRAVIRGYAGPAPEFRFRVVDETVVPVHAFIICSTNGTPARTEAGIRSLLDGANDIYTQVGRRFDLASCSTITNQTWLRVNRNATGSWPLFGQIVSYASGTGGIEMYFTDVIQGANGLTTSNGVLIANSGTFITIAHELGHAQGLRDIYESRTSFGLAVTGVVTRARAPLDWGTSADEGYYPAGLLQESLIQRLLMYGISSPTKRDITRGDVLGIWRPRGAGQSFQESLAPIGFFSNAMPNPSSN